MTPYFLYTTSRTTAYLYKNYKYNFKSIRY